MNAFNQKLLFFILLLGSCHIYSLKKAVIVVPVADLIGQRIKYFNKGAFELDYYNLPLCGAHKNPFNSCPRIHQLLFNDIVNIKKETQNEALIEIPQLFYITSTSDTQNILYWTSKENLVTFDSLTKMKANLDTFPKSISFKENNLNNDNSVVTLAFPYYDPITKNKFSVGTRFVRTKKKYNKAIQVYVFNKSKNEVEKTTIPQKYCITNSFVNKKQAIKKFVQLLKEWISHDIGSIPYVWGGSSYTYRTKEIFNKEVSATHSWYQLPNFEYQPKPGFDCAGLIFRAAQICSIPFYFKNSTTISKYLKPISDSIKAGDIIVIRGHVIVISDVKNNKIIEARHYNHHYGIVHEINLSEQFKGINTYQDLLQAYKNATPLKRVDKNGKVLEVLFDFKILSLESVWDIKIPC